MLAPRRHPGTAPRALRALVPPLLAGLSAACSIRDLAIESLTGSFSSVEDSFARDDDPELVREALPFALKSIEALLLESPDSKDLLLAATSGFVTYAHAFLELDADLVEEQDFARACELRDRALGLYLRARDYGLRGLELYHPGIGVELRREPKAAARRLGEQDVPLAYWTGAAWGAAIGVGLDRPEIVADVDAVRALLRRILELDPGFQDGAVHEAMISIEALPALMGGSPERARAHLDRAISLGRGHSAGPYVTYARGICVPAQDRAEFERLLKLALAVDTDAVPSRRLANLLAQKKARYLLEHADDLFL